jgi:hypothetical protein
MSSKIEISRRLAEIFVNRFEAAGMLLEASGLREILNVSSGNTELAELQATISDMQTELAAIKDECIDHVNLYKAWTHERETLTAENERLNMVNSGQFRAIDRIHCMYGKRLLELTGEAQTVLIPDEEFVKYFEEIKALKAEIERLKGGQGEPVPSEAELIAAGFGYPISKEDAVKAYKASLQPRTDHPSNADCEWCHGCGHDPYGDPCVGCCAPSPVAYTTLGMLEIAKRIPLTGHIGAKVTKDERWNVPLYTSQPAPVSVDLSDLREYHVKAISNLKSYADDSGLRDSDIKHYTKRAAFHENMVALIDKVKELNQ